MSGNDYDLITIGAGSGGVAASRYAASRGVRVAICEAGRVGGTCVLRGCVPKKIFMYGAQLADGFADAAAYGWQLPAAPRFDLARLTAAKNAETRRLEGVYQRLLDEAGVETHHGWAELEDAHTVRVGGRRLRAGRILLATGSASARPAIPGGELALDSEQMLELTQLPRRLLILGGGYIAVEFAGIFRGFGSEVRIACRGSLPLRGFDHDLRRRLAQAMEGRGIALQPGFQPARLERAGSGIVCHGTDGSALHADVVLDARGRRPSSAGMGLERAGVALDPDSGAVRVDAWSRSSVPHIYAVGDVTDRLMLTPVAIAEARAFVDSEFGGTPRAVDHATVASAVFAQPALAQIGLSEEAAQQRGHRLEVYEADFRAMKTAFAGRAERSYMKLVTDADSGRVLGLHMLGADAPEIVQSLAVAVTMGAHKRDFDATMAVHPTVAEEFMLMRKPRG